VVEVKMAQRTLIFWLLALLVTLTSIVWQRLSGPTHPIRLHEVVGRAEVKGKLLRSHSTSSDLPITLEIVGNQLQGRLLWRRYPTADEWSIVPLVPEEGSLQAFIPAQPSAGKVEYKVVLSRVGEEQEAGTYLPAGEAVVARFKNDVPTTVLIFHIVVMFLAMLWSSRAGLEAACGGPAYRRQALVTLALLIAGGLILGPIVQKYAFDAYWTGWPFGEDLTDNKVAVAVAVWLIAILRCRGNKGRGAVLAAAVVTLVIFAIPHSMHGSTLDYETMQKVSG
jgi:hypothetical protein